MEDSNKQSSLKKFMILSISSILVSVVLYNMLVPWAHAGKIWNKGMGLQSAIPLSDSEQIGKPSRKNVSVAIGIGITSKGSRGKFKQGFLILIPTFKELLPSFCNTASPGYKYHFYFAHDSNDAFFMKPHDQMLWIDTFWEVTKQKCKALGNITVQLVKCDHSGRPAWAQNDAMMATYRDGHDFFYRVNDDTIMLDKDWTNIFIKALMNMKPPLVGVVGPTHSGGNTGILTYDFVHRIHIDIFGYYYPRAFPWWYADDWITFVYGKTRSKKIRTVKLKHTQSISRRYDREIRSRKFVNKIIDDSRLTLERYLGNVSDTQLYLQLQQLRDSKWLPNITYKENLSHLPNTTPKMNVSQLPSTIH